MSEEYQVIDLGPVVGADGGFGNVTSEYVNDGGDPGVEITMTGEDRAKDFHFAFKNLVNDPLTASEVERIAAGEMVNSSNTANGTSMSLFFAELSKLFAGIAHTHDAKDIVSGEIGAALIGEAAVGADELADNAVTADKIADNAVGTQQLAQSVRDSLSLTSASSDVVQFNLTNERRIRFALYDAPDDGSTGPYLAVNVMSRGEWQTMKRIAAW